jgi:hypothetical protein
MIPAQVADKPRASDHADVLRQTTGDAARLRVARPAPGPVQPDTGASRTSAKWTENSSTSPLARHYRARSASKMPTFCSRRPASATARHR